MKEILHHLGCIKPSKWWDIYHINWCGISSINRTTQRIHLFNILHLGSIVQIMKNIMATYGNFVSTNGEPPQHCNWTPLGQRIASDCPTWKARKAAFVQKMFYLHSTSSIFWQCSKWHPLDTNEILQRVHEFCWNVSFWPSTLHPATVSVASSIECWEQDKQHAYAHKPQQELKRETIRAVASIQQHQFLVKVCQDMILAWNRLIPLDQSVSPKFSFAVGKL